MATRKKAQKLVYRLYHVTEGRYGRLFQVKGAAEAQSGKDTEVHTFALVRYEEPQLTLEV